MRLRLTLSVLFLTLLGCKSVSDSQDGLTKGSFARSPLPNPSWDFSATARQVGDNVRIDGLLSPKNTKNFLVSVEDSTLSEVRGTSFTVMYPTSSKSLLRIQLKNKASGAARRMSIPVQKDAPARLIQNAKTYFHKDEPIPFLVEDLWAYHFAELPFTPAPPPMQARYDENQEETLSPDSVFNLRSSNKLSDVGLYFVQTDTNTTVGNGFLIVQTDYPKFQKVEDLVHPLLYISTKEETQQILKASDKKAALDMYWLKQADGRVAAAKTMIRTFYNRVAYANHFFASYKAGWQSDRGMIHIVFGEPEQKIRTSNGESWFYTRIEDGDSYDFSFDFDYVHTPLSANHYVLRRTRDHKVNWYRGVAAWRNYEGWF